MRPILKYLTLLGKKYNFIHIRKCLLAYILFINLEYILFQVLSLKFSLGTFFYLLYFIKNI